MKLLVVLFYEFAKVGLFSVGGGLATLPFLYSLSDQMGWFTSKDVADMLAISESTPGALGINMATYAGYLTAGIPGGIIATLGLITPSIIIILIIARLLKSFQDNPYVEMAFYGLRPASIALIAAAGFSIFQVSLLDIEGFQQSGSFADLFLWKAILLGVILFFLQKKTHFHPILFIILAALTGILFKF